MNIFLSVTYFLIGPMLRFDVLPRTPISALTQEPMEQSNQTPQACPAALGGGYGPIEGRPPGPLSAHCVPFLP